MRTCIDCGAGFDYDRRTPNRTRCSRCRVTGTAERDALLARLLGETTVELAAAEVGLHPDTVRRLVRTGRVVPVDPPPPAPAHEWRDAAACRTAGIDAELWYAPDGVGNGGGDAYRDARRICSVCLVKAECLAEGHRVDAAWHIGGVGHGLWGGFSPAERARMRVHSPIHSRSGAIAAHRQASTRPDTRRTA